MDEKEFAARTTRLEKIAKVLEKLPSEVRASAFDLLVAYVTGRASDADEKKKPLHKDKTGSDEDDATFFRGFDHSTPADNAKLIAANHYRKYGSASFSTEEVKKCAENVGITIPARVDATFEATMEKGKKLFARAGRGKFKPTVHGETYLRSTYSVKKGTQSPPGIAE
jgi:hypothetical protein